MRRLRYVPGRDLCLRRRCMVSVDFWPFFFVLDFPRVRERRLYQRAGFDGKGLSRTRFCPRSFLPADTPFSDFPPPLWDDPSFPPSPLPFFSRKCEAVGLVGRSRDPPFLFLLQGFPCQPFFGKGQLLSLGPHFGTSPGRVGCLGVVSVNALGEKVTFFLFCPHPPLQGLVVRFPFCP